MKLAKLYLQDFRQFTQATWEMIPQTNVIIAPNGSGKTTILEAIYLLATARSFRASKTAQMLRFGQEVARVYALTDDNLRLGITLTGGTLGGRRTPVKTYTLDKAHKRQKDFVGTLASVCFRPEDLRLIEGAASRRRDFLDEPLLMTSSVYAAAHKNYHAALIRRNKTLAAIAENELTTDALVYWDNQLLEYGSLIQKERDNLCRYINENVAFPRDYTLEYTPNLVTRERLDSHRSAAIAVGHTLVGPHKDDLIIKAPLGGQIADLAIYGSRGQQRLAVLWLKLAQKTYLRQKTGSEPILLLDDIFSELDDTASQLVLGEIDKGQTFVTSTHENVIQSLHGRVKTINLDDRNLVAQD